MIIKQNASLSDLLDAVKGLKITENVFLLKNVDAHYIACTVQVKRVVIEMLIKELKAYELSPTLSEISGQSFPNY